MEKEKKELNVERVKKNIENCECSAVNEATKERKKKSRV